MSDAPTIEGLQARLAERNREIARLRAELASRDISERARIQEQLRRAEEQARDLIRYAPSGIYEVDARTGRFRSVNDAMCEILGYTREELLGMSGFDLLDDAGKALFADRIRRSLAGETVDSSVEYCVKKKDGEIIYVILSSRLTYRDGQPDSAFVIAHDVTERRRATAEREAILAAIADGLAVIDAEGRMVRLNAAAQALLGFSDEQRNLPIRERVTSILCPRRSDNSPYLPDEFPPIRALAGEVVANEEIILQVPARAGGLLRMSISSAPIHDPDGRVVGAVSTFSDVEPFHAVGEELRRANTRLEAQAAELTQAAGRLREALEAVRSARDELDRRVQERTAELAASREALRAYARKLVEAIENERRNLARELHDQAGQSMSALKLSLGRLRCEVDGRDKHAERFDEVNQLVDDVMDDLHRLAVNLRPVSLDRYGLMVALEQYVEFYREQSGLDVDLVAVGIEEQRLPPDVEITFYRVVQEALTNVLRHAEARHVGVMLERRGRRVIGIVEDDGKGFDVDEALRRGRLGLLGMRERAEMLGGSLTIESAAGSGTTVYIDVTAPEQ